MGPSKRGEQRQHAHIDNANILMVRGYNVYHAHHLSLVHYRAYIR